MLLFDKEHQCHTCLSYLFAFWPDNMTFHDNILNLQHHQSSSAVTISHFQYMIIVAKRIHDYDVMTNLFKKKKCKSVKFTFNFVDCMLCLFFFSQLHLNYDSSVEKSVTTTIEKRTKRTITPTE